MGNAVVLAAVACEFDNPVSEDFTPLTVQYIEKLMQQQNYQVDL